MVDWLSEKTGVEAKGKLPPMALMYLLTVYLPSRKEGIPPGIVRQMRTLCSAIDQLCPGKFLAGLDVLVQRMKASETSITYGGWANVQWMELLPRPEVSMTDEGENSMAAKEDEKAQRG